MSKANIQKEDIKTAAIIQLLKSICAQIPGLNYLVDQFSNYQQVIQYNNMADVLNKHSVQLRKLQNQAVNKSYMNDVSYVKDILMTVQRAKDELNEEKRYVYASYLTSCCHMDNANDRNKGIYLEYIESIDFVDLFILKSLTRFYNGKNVVEDCTELYNINHDVKASKIDIRIHIDHLASLGIIEECDREEVDRFNKSVGINEPIGKSFRSMNYYKRSYLGDGLFEFIKKADANQFQCTNK